MYRHTTYPAASYTRHQLMSQHNVTVAKTTPPSRAFLCAAIFCVAFLSSPAAAETAAKAWLRYALLDPQAAKQYQDSPSRILLIGDSLVLKTARQELTGGVQQMLVRSLETTSNPKNAFVLGTLKNVRTLAPTLEPAEPLKADAFWLKTTRIRGARCIVITATNDRGVLYGVFTLLSKIARGESIATLDDIQQPYAPVRWINQWDNLDGSIERGYGGPSIFFEAGKVRADLTPAAQYARLLASVGINACTVNNVVSSLSSGNRPNSQFVCGRCE